MFWVFQKGDGSVAHLPQVKTAQIAGHTHGDAFVGRDQYIGESGGQKSRLLHLTIIVVHKVHSILVDIPEQLRADRV